VNTETSLEIKEFVARMMRPPRHLMTARPIPRRHLRSYGDDLDRMRHDGCGGRAGRWSG
jgi:hypothetical protein